MTRSTVKETTIDLAGRLVPVRLTRNVRARRIILRVDGFGPGGDGITVTLPRNAAQREGLKLVMDKADWVLKRLAELAPRVTFADGAVVPLGGVDYLIRHVPGVRARRVPGGASPTSSVVWRDGAEIFVTGGLEHLARRLKDWFRAEARRHIIPRVRDKAAALGRAAGRITIRDTKSRWGSCSHDGNLSFCWRLVMAPDGVLDYVVAHEVAHLAEPNHGAEFWRAVRGLTEDVDGSQEWLRRNGEGLHRFG